jgi:hypothetical protein
MKTKLLPTTCPESRNGLRRLARRYDYETLAALLPEEVESS